MQSTALPPWPAEIDPEPPLGSRPFNGSYGDAAAIAPCQKASRIVIIDSFWACPMRHGIFTGCGGIMRWIVTDNTYGETWRQLLEFANIDLTIDVISKRHGQPNLKSEKDNYKKQAIQARVCVLQAKEYFDAARDSSVFTSANHCYYGAISLASLSMLILGDGTRSLDYLRQDQKNCHHGLDFTVGCNAKSASEGTNLLEKSFVEILGFGQFPNWYGVLPERGDVYATVRHLVNNVSHSGWSVAGTFANKVFSDIKGKKYRLLQLLKYFPDLNGDLWRYGISVPSSRGDLIVTHNNDRHVSQYEWLLHGCASEHDRDALLDQFQIESRFAENLSVHGTEGTKAGIVTLTIPHGHAMTYMWPSSRDTMNHDTTYYAGLEDGFEVVDLYLAAYQLSMLSRYYPDIWISCIESQCRAAKLVERAVEVIVKKLPILILSLVQGEEIIISTHRQPRRQ